VLQYVAVKKRPALPSKAALLHRRPPANANTIAPPSPSTCASLFPEKSDDEIAAAIARANGDQAQAIDFLTSSGAGAGGVTDALRPPRPPRPTQYAQVPSGPPGRPRRCAGRGASNGPGRSRPCGAVTLGRLSVERWRVYRQRTRGPFGAVAAAAWRRCRWRAARPRWRRRSGCAARRRCWRAWWSWRIVVE
jgi:hypothetical protein